MLLKNKIPRETISTKILYNNRFGKQIRKENLRRKRLRKKPKKILDKKIWERDDYEERFHKKDDPQRD